MDFLNAFLVLNGQGSVAVAERALIIHAVLLMLIVAVPVLVLTFLIAWRYRAGNRRARYVPDWEHGKMEELVWWAIPIEIVLILGALTWSSTHELDPKLPLSDSTPLVVQVVALDWKWLFLYPEQKIATVNYIAVPVDRQLRFEITADAPMNSFWIPQLGGQIYAMTGMVNVLHLVANKQGTFKGLSANYSGEGFAGMRFTVVATPQEEFDAWVQTVKESSSVLDQDTYRMLAKPSIANPAAYYGSFDQNLLPSIMKKFTGSEAPPRH